MVRGTGLVNNADVTVKHNVSGNVFTGKLKHIEGGGTIGVARIKWHHLEHKTKDVVTDDLTNTVENPPTPGVQVGASGEAYAE